MNYLGLEILAEVKLVPGCSILYSIACSDTPPLVPLCQWIHPPVLGVHQCSYLSNITSLIQEYSYLYYTGVTVAFRVFPPHNIQLLLVTKSQSLTLLVVVTGNVDQYN